MRGVVVLDEAYVDFAEENAMALSMRHPHVLVSRTFPRPIPCASSASAILWGTRT